MPIVLIAGFLGYTGITNSYCHYSVLRNESANKDEVCFVLLWFPFFKAWKIISVQLRYLRKMSLSTNKGKMGGSVRHEQILLFLEERTRKQCSSKICAY